MKLNSLDSDGQYYVCRVALVNCKQWLCQRLSECAPAVPQTNLISFSIIFPLCWVNCPPYFLLISFINQYTKKLQRNRSNQNMYLNNIAERRRVRQWRSYTAGLWRTQCRTSWEGFALHVPTWGPQSSRNSANGQHLSGSRSSLMKCIAVSLCRASGGQTSLILL